MQKLFLVLCLFSSSLFAKHSAHLPQGIKWHTDKVEKAFELAKQEKKPLFLYWGAVWCPPCNYIKKNIFTTELFKTEIKNYIAIYLDGDSKDAQTWGEKLKTLGYPTMLILNSEAQEIMRLPTGGNVYDYVSLMKRSRDNQFVMSERIKRAESGKATESDWELLSGYSWDQDPSLSADGLYKKAPEGKYKSKLYFAQLLASEEPEKDPAYFEEIIQDENLSTENFSTFGDYASKIFKTVYEGNDSAKKAAAKLFLPTLNKMGGKKPSFYDQVQWFFPLLVIDEILEGKVSQLHLEQVKRITAKANYRTKGIYERQSVMSLAVDLLETAKLYEDAKKLATSELKISKSPFYFMSSLASIAKAQGDMKGSLEWSKKAWEISTGANSRFQWGASYINKLLDSENKNNPTVKDEILSVIKAGLSNEESFKSRNKGRFEKLGKRITEWGKSNSEAYTDLKKTVGLLCEKNTMKAECSTWVSAL